MQVLNPQYMGYNPKNEGNVGSDGRWRLTSDNSIAVFFFVAASGAVLGIFSRHVPISYNEGRVVGGGDEFFTSEVARVLKGAFCWGQPSLLGDFLFGKRNNL